MKTQLQEAMTEKLKAAFPAIVVGGEIASHNCLECDVLRRQLDGVTWLDVPEEFVKDHGGDLPLLSKEAYKAFLPAWLLSGIRDPDGPVAGMLMVNLRSNPDTGSFTLQQAAAVIESARFITENSIYGREDPVHVASIAEIERVWRCGATQQAVATDRGEERRSG